MQGTAQSTSQLARSPLLHSASPAMHLNPNHHRHLTHLTQLNVGRSSGAKVLLFGAFYRSGAVLVRCPA